MINRGNDLNMIKQEPDIKQEVFEQEYSVKQEMGTCSAEAGIPINSGRNVIRGSVCSECQKNFSCETDLQLHFRLAHSTEPLLGNELRVPFSGKHFSCQDCGIKFVKIIEIYCSTRRMFIQIIKDILVVQIVPIQARIVAIL